MAGCYRSTDESSSTTAHNTDKLNMTVITKIFIKIFILKELPRWKDEGTTDEKSHKRGHALASYTLIYQPST